MASSMVSSFCAAEVWRARWGALLGWRVLVAVFVGGSSSSSSSVSGSESLSYNWLLSDSDSEDSDVVEVSEVWTRCFFEGCVGEDLEMLRPAEVPTAPPPRPVRRVCERVEFMVRCCVDG